MGGGNAQKSAMARLRNAKKNPAAKKNPNEAAKVSTRHPTRSCGGAHRRNAPGCCVLAAEDRDRKRRSVESTLFRLLPALARRYWSAAAA